MFMVGAYLLLGFFWFWLLFDFIGKDIKPKKDLGVLLFVAFVLGTSFLFPSGMIPIFKESSSRSILTASAEGAANCMSTFYLLDEMHFAENTVCFGSNHLSGNYTKRNDTLFFEVTEPGRANHPYFQFAVFRNDSVQGKLLMFYDNYTDTNPRRLWIRDLNND